MNPINLNYNEILDQIILKENLKSLWRIREDSVRSKLYHSRKKFIDLMESKNNNGSKRYELWAAYTALDLPIPVKTRRVLNYGVRGKRKHT